MGKCLACLDRYHPDYMVEKEIRGDIVNICVFCATDKKTLTITDKDDKVIEIVDKKETSIKYNKYLDDLTKKSDIANILSKG